MKAIIITDGNGKLVGARVPKRNVQPGTDDVVETFEPARGHKTHEVDLTADPDDTKAVLAELQQHAARVGRKPGGP